GLVEDDQGAEGKECDEEAHGLNQETTV
ncbi:MAG: hypothetical protein QG596_123, partial [Actinomycetota bacterium]|nr:hypothetical protein [Actinomycetota bacterium]